MFSEQHGYAQRGIAGKRNERPKGPWVMDEQPRTIDVGDALRQGGFDAAADALDKVRAIAKGEMPKPKSPVDLLREAGHDKAADYLEKIRDTVTTAGEPQYLDQANNEAGIEQDGGSEPTEAQFEPRALAAEDVDAGYDAAFETTPTGERGAAAELAQSAPSQLAEGLAKLAKPVTEHDLTTQTDAYSIESGSPVAETARFQPGESPFEHDTIDPHSHEAEVIKNIETLQADLQETIKQVGEAMDAGEHKKAAELTKQLAEKMQKSHGEKMPEDVRKQYEDVIATLDKAIAEADPEESSLLRRLGSGALDFIPVAGPAKMCAEAAYGQTLGGEKLEGWSRGLHATEGVVCLIIDCSGAGAAVTKGGKALVVGGKVTYKSAKFLTRSAAAMRKVGAARKVYEPAFKAGKFLARHPGLEKVADKGLGYMLSGRKRRLLGEVKKSGVESIKQAMAGDGDMSRALRQMATIHERPGMQLHTPPDYGLAEDQSEAMAA